MLAPASTPDVPRGTSGGASSCSQDAAGCSSPCASIAASSALRIRAPISGGEPTVHHHGAVILVPVRECALVVLGVGAFGLLGPPCPAIQAHELLDVLGGPVQADLED